ncbi:hypothetical protein COCC4DRAFT_155416, partial [Bipolaris maydis ATCC 48331]
RDGVLRDLEPRDDPLPFDVDVPWPLAVSLLVKERILLVTCNTTLSFLEFVFNSPAYNTWYFLAYMLIRGNQNYKH